jgi:hypothetical protein
MTKIRTIFQANTEIRPCMLNNGRTPFHTERHKRNYFVRQNGSTKNEVLDLLDLVRWA